MKPRISHVSIQLSKLYVINILEGLYTFCLFKQFFGHVHEKLFRLTLE